MSRAGLTEVEQREGESTEEVWVTFKEELLSTATEASRGETA